LTRSNLFIADSSAPLFGLPRVALLVAFRAPARFPHVAALSGGTPDNE